MIYIQVIEDSYIKNILKKHNDYKIFQHEVKIDEDDFLEAGDHIYIIIWEPICYEHHGIYVGNNKVIHFANMIIECSLQNFAHNLVVRKASSKYVSTLFSIDNYFFFRKINKGGMNLGELKS